MKKLTSLFLCIILLSGCSITTHSPKEQKQYTATFLNIFDTVTTIVGKADSEEAFQEKVKPLHKELERYHKLFDIYNDYDGINNLKTVNDKAAISPVTVDPEIIELLFDCKNYYKDTNGIFNPAMGSVLRIWHDAREDGYNDPENAYLPDSNELREAAKHMDPDNIVLDRENSTVFFTDPKLKLDVGGIAKGWATKKACEKFGNGLLVSVGGNICSTGPKDEKGNPWVVGIQNPDGSDNYLNKLNIIGDSVVTSGNYQRFYVVDEKKYHHIIDPATLYPREKWTAVTVVCEDSGLADALSTALFLLDREEGQKLLDTHGAHAMWVDKNMKKHYSPDFKNLIRN